MDNVATNKDVLLRIMSQYNDAGEKKAIQGMKNIQKQSNLQTKIASVNAQTNLYNSKRYVNALTKQKRAVDDFNKSIGKTPFAGWAMSIMFAGMALQRLSMSLYKFGTKAFQEVTHSVEGMVTQTDMLDGSMKFLGYTIGEALEPLVAFLVPIVDKISDWVQQNPELVRGVTAFFAVIGTAAMAGGALVLAKNGFSDLISIIKTTNWAALGQKVQTGIGVVSVGFGIAWTAEALASMGDDSFFSTLAKTAGGVVTTVGGMKMLTKGGGAAGAGLIAIGVGLKLLGENTFMQSVGKILNPFIALFMTAWDRIKYEFEDRVFAGILNSLIDLIETVSFLDDIFPKLGSAINDMQAKIRGKDDDFDFTKRFQKNIGQLQENERFQDSYLKGLTTPVEGATFSNTVVGDKPVYYINIQEIIAEGMNIESVLEEISRVGGIGIVSR